jgi:hypothetical protein
MQSLRERNNIERDNLELKCTSKIMDLPHQQTSRDPRARFSYVGTGGSKKSVQLQISHVEAGRD